MDKLSAKMIGELVGKSATEINKILFNEGLLTGKPGNWNLTKLGEKYGEIKDKTNGYGGYAHRSWSFIMWNKDVVDKFFKK